jgi:lipoprotein-anchoring transpeptidase ErfK/SrfK
MKAIVSIFGLASALVSASIVFAADSSVQPLTRADCDKAGMRWNEGANVCAEPTSTAAPTGSSTVFAADTSSQPLTRADCDKAGLRWNEGANVCSESISTIGQAEAKPKSTPGTKGSSILIAIDKTTQKMSVFIEGTKKYDWRVSTGRPGYSTPSGTYTATSMNEVWYSKEWDNAPMPHAIFFMMDGHAIHGSYEVRNLGKPVSHGCVRIAPQNATLLYQLVGKNGLKNTQVVLTGVTPGGESKVASRTPRQKPQVASRVTRNNIAGKPKAVRRSGPGSRYAQADPRWNGVGDQPRRGGFFRRLFSGPSYNGPQVYYRPALTRGY